MNWTAPESSFTQQAQTTPWISPTTICFKEVSAVNVGLRQSRLLQTCGQHTRHRTNKSLLSKVQELVVRTNREKPGEKRVFTLLDMVGDVWACCSYWKNVKDISGIDAESDPKTLLLKARTTHGHAEGKVRFQANERLGFWKILEVLSWKKVLASKWLLDSLDGDEERSWRPVWSSV